ncbi:type II secretion system major pseudopilin GspG [Azospirillum sp. ST 5-10]|uniref:type II secretion system major pseudopilin GspG n=1 Tax=unclassified Azospirillum TaxID=2630922 RepID=UPI003F4A532F
MTARRRRRDERGVTLLEMLLVLVILGMVVAVLAAPQLFRQLGSAKQKMAAVQLETLAGALDLYRLEVGRYPTQQEALTALVERPSGVSGWNGPYLKKLDALKDPWGQSFVYRIPGQHGDFDLYTLGADQTVGGDGENRDVTSW